MSYNECHAYYGTWIRHSRGGTMKRQSTRTYAASLHKVDQRYERRLMRTAGLYSSIANISLLASGSSSNSSIVPSYSPAKVARA